ncbi:FAD-binding protein [Umezawaea sp. NPDC059074]|uniref:FAD-binding protein n=1 Tax=Umezawaea sp. NPDC059074 TaxID=3346716 RepID=UPI00368AAA40
MAKSAPVRHATYFDPSDRRFTAEARSGFIPLPPLDGQVAIHDEALAAASDDFGHLVHHRPLAVLQPGSAADLVAFSSFSSELAIPLVPRGQGHSTAGQAQTADGVVVDMSLLQEVHDIGADHVVVDAGARWSQVLDATLPHGLTPPVLTDYLELSVGGTLSVGGIGGASHHHGAQTDNVLALDVITPDGDPRTCYPGSELFSSVLAGRGRHGVIVRARLRLIPAPQQTRTYRLSYTDLADFLADQRLLMAERRVDHLVGQVKLDQDTGWSYVTYATTYDKSNAGSLLTGLTNQHPDVQEDRDYPTFLHQMADDVALLESLGLWSHSHPWLNLIVPDHAVEDFVSRTLETTTEQELGDAAVILLYPLPTTTFTAPKLKMPTSTTAFLFALLRTAPQHEHDILDHMAGRNRELTRLLVQQGGVSYLEALR